MNGKKCLILVSNKILNVLHQLTKTKLNDLQLFVSNSKSTSAISGGTPCIIEIFLLSDGMDNERRGWELIEVYIDHMYHI